MAERPEESMDNEKDCRAENDSLSPKSSLVVAEAMDGRDEGMQKYVNGDNGVPGRETGEFLPSPRQSNTAENSIELEDVFAPSLDQGSALLSPLDEQQESAPIEDASEKRGLIDSKHAADVVPTDMEPESQGLKEIRQGEVPVEVEQESALKASAEILHEMDGEPSVEAQSIASYRHETEREQQDLAQPEQGSHGDSELGEGDTSGQDIEEQLINDAAGTFSMTGVSQEAGDVHQQAALELVEKDIVVSEEKSEEQIQDHSASEELNEQVDLDIPIGDVSEEPPALHDALLMKEPSLSTPAMEALIDAGDEEPSNEEESFGAVENSEQHLEANETHEDFACGDRQDAHEGIPNQVEVYKNEQERAENNTFAEDDTSLAAPESVDEVLIPGGQEVGMDMPFADKKDGKEELGNEQPLVFEQETEQQLPSNEVPSVEPHVERELDIEAPTAVGQGPTEQSLDTASASSDLEMAADISEKEDEAVPLKAEDILNADGDEVATSEVEEEGLSTGQDKSCVQVNGEALPFEGETGSSRAEAKIDAANGQLDEDNPNNVVQDEPGSVYSTPCSDTLTEANHLIENCDKSSSLSEPSSEREHEGQGIGSAITPTQLESTTDDISNGALESSVTSEGNSLQSCPSREVGIDVKGSHVAHSTEPVLELGKVNDDTIEGEAPIMTLSDKGLVYDGMTAEDDKQQSTSKPLIHNNIKSGGESCEVIEIGTHAAEAKDGDLDAGKGEMIVGAAKGVPSHTDATNTSNILAQENGSLKNSQEDFEKQFQAKRYTNGTANTYIADKENAQAFHNERSREASLSLVVPQQRDMHQRVLEDVGEMDTDRIKGRGTLVRWTNWWGCCGMLDLLLRRD